MSKTSMKLRIKDPKKEAAKHRALKQYDFLDEDEFLGKRFVSNLDLSDAYLKNKKFFGLNICHRC